MKKIYSLFLILFLPLLLYPQTPEFVSINGVVKYAFDSTLLSHSRIQLIENGKAIHETLTDYEGQFEIFVEKNNTYTLSFAGLEDFEFDTIINTGDYGVVLTIYVGIIIPERYLKYNSYRAKRDISEGNIQILTVGLHVVSAEDLKKITRKYGFTYKNLGQNVSDMVYQSIHTYNAVVYEYLEELNGTGWQEKFEQAKEKKTEKILHKIAKQMK